MLKTTPSIAPPLGPVTQVAVRGQVRFENVSYRYPGALDPVLRDIDFEVRAGQTTAIIGSTGAGKSTLLGLVPRLLDVGSGRVLVDGVDVRELDLDTLWSKIGVVPQVALLFSGTVASNLRYGNPVATEQDMWEALEAAQARDFIAALPGGLDAPVAQGGTNFSGGERQRISIARALIRKPEIYLFDDCFSALDFATEARMRQALQRVTRESAVIVVAQRVASIKEADQILVIDDGAILGTGTHETLLQTCGTYREIVESQQLLQESA